MAAASAVGGARAAVLCDDPGVTAIAVGDGWSRRRQYLLSEYERMALELFAAQGFRSVTFDDIAAAAGVSARTLFRYFPTKEDFLLGFPRRGVAVVTAQIRELEPCADPLDALWELRLESIESEVPDVELLALWRKAAAEAGDVVAIVRGERMEALMETMTEYCARSLGLDQAHDVRPRMLASIAAGAELALVEMITRSDLSVSEIADQAAVVMRDLRGRNDGRSGGVRPARNRRARS
jgi:AcrR family transcriptional regulator